MRISVPDSCKTYYSVVLFILYLNICSFLYIVENKILNPNIFRQCVKLNYIRCIFPSFLPLFKNSNDPRLPLRQLDKLLKMTYRSLFDGLRRRTYQYVHRRIRKHDGALLKKCKFCYCFLVKQQKEASELKSIYHFNFFLIYAKYNCIYRVQTVYIFTVDSHIQF